MRVQRRFSVYSVHHPYTREPIVSVVVLVLHCDPRTKMVVGPFPPIMRRKNNITSMQLSDKTITFFAPLRNANLSAKNKRLLNNYKIILYKYVPTVYIIIQYTLYILLGGFQTRDVFLHFINLQIILSTVRKYNKIKQIYLHICPIRLLCGVYCLNNRSPHTPSCQCLLLFTFSIQKFLVHKHTYRNIFNSGIKFIFTP